MDYDKHYNKLISTRLKLKRIKGKNEYFERHHIIPKCLGGSNDKSNLILLNAREHYIAHKLLTKIFPNNNKLLFAIWKLSHDRQNNYIKINSQKYKKLKESYSRMMSIKSKNRYPSGPFVGKKHSNYSKKLISESISGENNGNFNIDPWKHSSVIHKNDIIKIYKNLNIIYEIWELSNKCGYRLLEHECNVNNIITTRKYQGTFQSIIKWFNINGNPVYYQDWIKWNNNIPIIPKNLIIFDYHPWDSGLVKYNHGILNVWKNVQKIYNIWKIDTDITHKKFSTKCYNLGLIDKKYHMIGFIKWFKKYGNPKYNNSWNYKFNQ